MGRRGRPRARLQRDLRDRGDVAPGVDVGHEPRPEGVARPGGDWGRVGGGVKPPPDGGGIHSQVGVMGFSGQTKNCFGWVSAEILAKIMFLFWPFGYVQFR